MQENTFEYVVYNMVAILSQHLYLYGRYLVQAKYTEK